MAKRQPSISTPDVWQHINAVQQYVREKLEQHFGVGYHVTDLRGSLSSRYMPSPEALGVDPAYICTSTVATFHAFLENDMGQRIRCAALLGVDGRLEVGGVQHSQ